MKTRNLDIYHCLSCGTIRHCEPETESPQCCGKPMIRAAAETVVSDECAADRGASPEHPERGAPPGPTKPR